MFKYSFKKIVVKNNKLKVEMPNKGLVSNEIVALLSAYEEEVYTKLKGLYDFKYVQSSVGAFSVFNALKEKLPVSIKVEMMTRHPSFIGGILLNTLIPCCIAGDEVYAVYFKGDFGKCWLNSQAKSEMMVYEIEKLLSISFLKKDIALNLIEIFGSDKLVFEESQIGAKSKRWLLKIKQ